MGLSPSLPSASTAPGDAPATTEEHTRLRSIAEAHLGSPSCASIITELRQDLTIAEALLDAPPAPVAVDKTTLDIAQAHAEIQSARTELAGIQADLDAARARLAAHDHAPLIDLISAQVRISKATTEVTHITDHGPGRWRASIPPQPGVDTELIIKSALSTGEAALAEVGRLRDLVIEILGHINQPGHPGEPCRRSGWISEKQLTTWRQATSPTRRTATDQGARPAAMASEEATV
jgi:hypothetical protein